MTGYKIDVYQVQIHFFANQSTVHNCQKMTNNNSEQISASLTLDIADICLIDRNMTKMLRQGGDSLNSKDLKITKISLKDLGE